ncbi:3-deoxy-manno-octulosonate cytidylyltransferase [Lacibacter sp. H375]|uniref:3-deoxy-manno-octulosonate cytidylyltransferase n=1 Tax=Lacibacter sp. H375 TaxID=3133424 RepID=UPI0030C3BD2E
MQIIAVIPARYAATRFPAKLMQMLGAKTVIRHTYENTVATGLFTDVLVVTDSDIIFQEITSNGGKAMMSSKEHESGTDRIAEAVNDMNVDVVINVQGDEPFVQKASLEKLCNIFQDQSVQVGSLMHILTDEEQINDPNCVKVVVNKQMDALYFSRSVIPYKRDASTPIAYYKHIGMYGYRKNSLLQFTALPASLLEQTEKLEQLRLLENGFRIRMAVTEPVGVSIDTPADLEKAKQLL